MGKRFVCVEALLGLVLEKDDLVSIARFLVLGDLTANEAIPEFTSLMNAWKLMARGFPLD